jgi:IMP dehydrogenase
VTLDPDPVQTEKRPAWAGKLLAEGLTYDDALLVPDRSDVLPTAVDTTAQLTRTIQLNVPLMSAAMDTVTEARMAITMARAGGIGVIHRSLSIGEQALEVDKVKRSQSGMIVNPVTLPPEATIAEANAVMARYRISGVPITDQNGELVGILTNRDLRFCDDETMRVDDLMTRDNLVTTPIGTTLEQAERVLHQYRIEKLPVVDEAGMLRGLITVKDISKRQQFPHAVYDDKGRLLVAAAVGTQAEGFDRARELASAGVDAIVVDSAHGHHSAVIEMVRRVSEALDVEVIGGNVATAAGASALIQAGADCVKVGIGPSAICTTRVVAGVGMPQLTAILDCAGPCSEHGIPLIADGGVRYSGDVAKAIAAGASAVMIGNLFAGTDDSPGEIVYRHGERYKEYRGMGSIGAMTDRANSTRDRYGQHEVHDAAKLVAEGVEAQTPYRGPTTNMIQQLEGGLRSAMGYVGARNVREMQTKARFVRVTAAGVEESHVHDVVLVKEAPNYQTAD